MNGNTLNVTGAGTVVVAADQAGNSNFAAATQVTHSIVVSKAVPAVGLTLSASPIFVQNALTIMATVSSSAGSPTGSVVFSDNGSALSTTTLAGGVATLAISTLSAGSHSITATYSGDANFTTTTSASAAETVDDFTLAVANSSQTVHYGGNATYALQVGLFGGTALPSTLSFSASGLPAGAVATFSPSSLNAGSAGTNVTLTIQAPQLAGLKTQPSPLSGLSLLALVLLPFPLIGMLRRGHGFGKLTLFVLLCAGLYLAGGLTGCGGGGGGNDAVPVLNDNVTVTATSGALSHSTTVTLTVQ